MRTLEITTNVGCPVNCDYCPQETLIAEYLKTANLFGKILTFNHFVVYLKNVPLDVRLDFSGFSEPFANNDVVEMMVYADSLGYKIAAYTTLFNFNINKIEKLEKIDFDRFVIHIKKEFAINIHEEVFKDTLKELINSKINLSYVAIDEPPKEIYDIIDKGINKVHKISRAGNVEYVKEKQGSYKCLRSNFDNNVLLPDGNVYLCCMDYGLKHHLGNLKDTNFNNLNRDKCYELCSKCELAK